MLSEALRECLAAELLSPGAVATAREPLDKVDAKLPSAIDRHPAGPAAGGLIAADESAAPARLTRTATASAR